MIEFQGIFLRAMEEIELKAIKLEEVELVAYIIRMIWITRNSLIYENKFEDLKMVV